MKNIYFSIILVIVTSVFCHTQILAQSGHKKSDKITEARPSPISGGYGVGKALRLVEPTVPPNGHWNGQETEISISIVIDEKGNVTSAKAIGGHPILRAACQAAARQSKFSPSFLPTENIKTFGEIIYNFQIVNGAPSVKIKIEFVVPIFTDEESKKLYSFSKIPYDLSNLYDYIKNKNYQSDLPKDFKLIWDDKRKLKVWTIDKTAATIDELKKIGFVVLQNSADTSYFVGSISAKNVEKLVASNSVLYIKSN